VPREKLGPGRIELTAAAFKVGRKILQECATFFSPATLLKWHRMLVACKYDGSGKRGPKPVKANEVRDLVLRMKAENPDWGYGHIHGELKGLGYKVSWQTVRRIMFEHGLLDARELGVVRQLVYQHRKRLGIAPLPRPARNQVLRKQQFADLPADLSARQVASRLRLSKPVALRYCREFGYVIPTKYDARADRRRPPFRRLKPGLTAGQIARRLGVSPFSAQYWAGHFGYALAPGRKLQPRLRRNRQALRKKIRRLPPGLTLQEVADRIGRSNQITKRWCLQFGYNCQPGGMGRPKMGFQGNAG